MAARLIAPARAPGGIILGAFAVALLATLSGCAQLTPDVQASAWRAPGLNKDGTRFILLGKPPVRLAIHETGHGRPVLMLHGLATYSYSWRYLVPALAKNRRVITVDLKGFGASDKPADGRYAIRDQAILIKALIDKLRLRGLTLVGHSYGGGIALLLALDQKWAAGRISRLVLIDSIAYPQEVPLFLSLLQAPVIGPLGMALVPARVQASQALALSYDDPDKISSEAVDAYARPLEQPGGSEALVETVRQLVPADLDQIARRYPTIRQPTLVIWCDHDRVVPLAIGQRLAVNLPHARFTLIRGCGHLPQEEKPVPTLGALKAFLR